MAEDEVAEPRGAATSPPTIEEIRAFTGKLRALSDAGLNADPEEYAAYQAAKRDLLARIAEAP